MRRNVWNPKNSQVAVNGSLDKALAFAPSIDKDWRKDQKRYNLKDQVETVDIIQEVQKQGWYLDSVYEVKNKNTGLIESHGAKLINKDLSSINNISGKPEMYATMNIENKICSPSTPAELDLGSYRLVCSNGMMANRSFGNVKFRDYEHLEVNVRDINMKAENVINEFLKLNEKSLTKQQMEKLAKFALKLRFGSDTKGINVEQVLKANRKEDEGDSLWSTFNRIQENLTKSGMLYGETGWIDGIIDANFDKDFNTELAELVYSDRYLINSDYDGI